MMLLMSLRFLISDIAACQGSASALAEAETSTDRSRGAPLIARGEDAEKEARTWRWLPDKNGVVVFDRCIELRDIPFRSIILPFAKSEIRESNPEISRHSSVLHPSSGRSRRCLNSINANSPPSEQFGFSLLTQHFRLDAAPPTLRRRRLRGLSAADPLPLLLPLELVLL